MSKFKERLRELRLERGLSKMDLGKVIDDGTSVHSIRKYEDDGLNAKTHNIIELARYFNVTTDYLLGISDVKTVDLTEVSSNELLIELKKRIR